MKKKFLFRNVVALVLLAAFLCFFSACHQEEVSIGGQPQLKTVKLTLNGQIIEAEVADTVQSRTLGLMFRKEMAEQAGMIFVFDESAPRSFWMKNTPRPLSIAFLDEKGTILEIYDMKPLDETIISSKSDQIRFALEMNQGWFQRHGVTFGTQLSGLPE